MELHYPHLYRYSDKNRDFPIGEVNLGLAQVTSNMAMEITSRSAVVVVVVIALVFVVR